MQMCNFCLDRLEEGKKPICVAGCPMRALDSGPLERLKAKYGEAREAEGFAYSDELKPSFFRLDLLLPFSFPKKNVRGELNVDVSFKRRA